MDDKELSDFCNDTMIIMPIQKLPRYKQVAKEYKALSRKIFWRNVLRRIMKCILIQ